MAAVFRKGVDVPWREVTTLSLQELITTYSRAGYTEEDKNDPVLREKHWLKWFVDAEESPAVARLVTELRERGSFDEAVRLHAESEELEADEEPGVEAWEFFPAVLGNGMHRVAAHYLSNLQLPVAVEIDHGYVKDAYDEEAPQLRGFVLPPPLDPTLTGEAQAELTDQLFETLSWRSSTGGWLRYAGGGAHNGGPESLWFELSEAPEAYALETLAAEVAALTAPLGYKLLALEWYLLSEEEDPWAPDTILQRWTPEAGLVAGPLPEFDRPEGR